jgi:hypothetical protein
MTETIEIEEMLGKVMTKAVNNDNEELIFESECGMSFKFYHEQDCCEEVVIEDIEGNLKDLIGHPILQAEYVTKEAKEEDIRDDSGTWTFYKYATIKGSVTVRWLGESNGYYSESVDLKISPIMDYDKFPQNYL